MAKDLNCTVSDLIHDESKRQQINIERYVNDEVGLPTLKDIMHELAQPGRDPRGLAEEFHFDDHVHTIEDLQVGMVLPGVVTNLCAFGAFVDLGVHRDGLVHISQLRNHKPLALQQHVMVCVEEVDMARQRINLRLAD